MTATARVIEASPWIPVAPTIRQLRFLSLPHREAFYGGAAGGGKSEGLLTGALMYADFPDYAAILFRRTYTDLALEGALMDRAADWLAPTAARWNERDKRWEFPSGATLTFGYLDGPNDWRRYDSAEFQYIGMDEATQFRPHDINALQGRLRRKRGSRIPLRFRLGSNPGGEAHAFLGERFVSPKEPHPERAFVPALFEDNPYLDAGEYGATLEALRELDPTLYRQRRYGEWIEDSGESVFKREWWEERNRYDPEDTRLVNRAVARFASLDTANKIKETSAYSALSIGELQPDYTMPLRHVARKKLEFPELVDWTIEELLPFKRDGKLKALYIEDAASGTQLIQTLRASGPAWLADLIVPVKPAGKEESWKAASVWCKRGMAPLPEPHQRAAWLHEWQEEVFSVPNTTYKDQADSFAMLVNETERRYGCFSQRWRAIARRANPDRAA
jgi:predicted phage terminase large subunit-like protein